MPVPVHILAGPLGVGKTTAVAALLAARADVERVGVVVNDVGLAGLDAERLRDVGAGDVLDVPGGCVCCTAPEGLVDALGALLDRGVDRLLIEPTGLADPGDLVDRLRAAPFADRLALQPVIVLVDPARLPEPGEGGPAHADAADILVVNRTDLASDAEKARAARWVAARWPAPVRVEWTDHGRLDPSALGWPEGAPVPAVERRPPPAHDHDHDHDHDGGATHGHRARSLVWGPDVRFDQDRLGRALARLLGGEAGAPLARLKGIFRFDEGTVRLEIAAGALHEAMSGYRCGSVVDVIVGPGAPDALDRAEALLAAAIVSPA